MNQFDDFTVDPETGEIVDAGVTRDPITEDLPRIARALRSIDKKIKENEEFIKIEIERIRAFSEATNESLYNQHRGLAAHAQQLMKAEDKDRLVYPGLGTFKWQKGRSKVMTKGWDEADYESHISIAMANPKLFKTKQVVLPDKREIKNALQGETSNEIRGLFSVFTPDDTFVFKGEV